MKKKIILGLTAYSVLFLFMGLYIVYTIQIGTAKLNDLIRLHQVEILREQFLIQIKRVQSDLALKHTHYSRKFDIVLRDVRDIEQVIDVCFGCHHSAAVQAGIDDLRDSTHLYKDAVSRVLTLHAGIRPAGERGGRRVSGRGGVDRESPRHGRPHQRQAQCKDGEGAERISRARKTFSTFSSPWGRCCPWGWPRSSSAASRRP